MYHDMAGRTTAGEVDFNTMAWVSCNHCGLVEVNSHLPNCPHHRREIKQHIEQHIEAIKDLMRHL